MKNPERVTPVDELTGLPLPLRPFNEAAETSWHHHAHPSVSDLLKGTGGVAVRSARLQLVEGVGGLPKRSRLQRFIRPNKAGQHSRYHSLYDGPPLPRTPEEQFEYCVWAFADYIPDTAIDLTGRRPKIAKLTPEQTDRLRFGGELRATHLEPLRTFLEDYLVTHGLNSIEPSSVDEFISTADSERRTILGQELLSRVTETASDPLLESYARARKIGRISHAAEPELPLFLQTRLKETRRAMLIGRLASELAAA